MLLCPEVKIGTGAIRTVWSCCVCSTLSCSVSVLLFIMYLFVCLFIGGIGKAGILKVLKGWRTESYVSLSLSLTHSKQVCAYC